MEIIKLLIRLLVSPFVFIVTTAFFWMLPFGWMMLFGGLCSNLISWLTNKKCSNELEWKMVFLPLYGPFYNTYIWIVKGEMIGR